MLRPWCVVTTIFLFQSLCIFGYDRDIALYETFRDGMIVLDHALPLKPPDLKTYALLRSYYRLLHHDDQYLANNFARLLVREFELFEASIDVSSGAEYLTRTSLLNVYFRHTAQLHPDEYSSLVFITLLYPYFQLGKPLATKKLFTRTPSTRTANHSDVVRTLATMIWTTPDDSNYLLLTKYTQFYSGLFPSSLRSSYERLYLFVCLCLYLDSPKDAEPLHIQSIIGVPLLLDILAFSRYFVIFYVFYFDILYECILCDNMYSLTTEQEIIFYFIPKFFRKIEEKPRFVGIKNIDLHQMTSFTDLFGPANQPHLTLYLLDFTRWKNVKFTYKFRLFISTIMLNFKRRIKYIAVTSFVFVICLYYLQSSSPEISSGDVVSHEMTMNFKGLSLQASIESMLYSNAFLNAILSGDTHEFPTTIRYPIFKHITQVNSLEGNIIVHFLFYSALTSPRRESVSKKAFDWDFGSECVIYLTEKLPWLWRLYVVYGAHLYMLLEQASRGKIPDIDITNREDMFAKILRLWLRSSFVDTPKITEWYREVRDPTNIDLILIGTSCHLSGSISPEQRLHCSRIERKFKFEPFASSVSRLCAETIIIELFQERHAMLDILFPSAMPKHSYQDVTDLLISYVSMLLPSFFEDFASLLFDPLLIKRNRMERFARICGPWISGYTHYSMLFMRSAFPSLKAFTLHEPLAFDVYVMSMMVRQGMMTMTILHLIDWCFQSLKLSYSDNFDHLDKLHNSALTQDWETDDVFLEFASWLCGVITEAETSSKS